MKKIQHKLIVSFLSVTVIAVSTIGGYALNSITDVISKISIERQENRISLISQGIEKSLEEVLLDLSFLSETASIKRLMESLQTGDEKQIEVIKKNLEQDFLSFSTQKRTYQKIRFIEKNGDELVRVDREGKQSKIVKNKNLENIEGTYYFEDTLALNDGGIVISSLELIRKDDVVETPIRPTIRYATPIFDKKNTVRGILMLNVQARDFLNTIRNSLKEKDMLFLIDNDGYYLFHPDKKREWGSQADLNTGENFMDDFEDTTLDQIVESKQLLTLKLPKNILSTIPVFLNSEKTLFLGYLVEVVPKKVIFAPTHAFKNIFIIVAVSVIFISLLFSILLAGSITKPLVYLTRGAEEMSKGNLEKTIKVRSKDEIKILADSIERLRKSVKILLDRAKKKAVANNTHSL